MLFKSYLIENNFESLTSDIVLFLERILVLKMILKIKYVKKIKIIKILN